MMLLVTLQARMKNFMKRMKYLVLSIFVMSRIFTIHPILIMLYANMV